jgi:hypothetical protein
MTILRELSRYTRKLDLAGVQEVRWEGGGTEIAGEYGKGNENHELGTVFFVHKRTISAVIEFVRDRMPYIIIKIRWCHIVVLNVHATTDDKSNEVKDSSYEELELVFDKFPR